MEYLGTEKPINKIEPKVSICIVTYNHEQYIAQCLDSILMQETVLPYEIILGEDDSKDNTRSICKEYAEKYPDKIRLFLRSDKDKVTVRGKKSFHNNFIQNIKSARGEYIALCDGDDYWLVKDKLQMQYDFMQDNENCSLICHKMPSFKKSKTGWYNFKDLARVAYLPHCSNYFMRSFDVMKYEKAFYEFLGGEMLMLYIAASEGDIYHDERVVSHYRQNEGGIYTSLSRTSLIERWMDELKIVHKHFPLPKLIYFERKMNLILLYNRRTGKRSIETVIYRFIKRLFRAKDILVNVFKSRLEH